MSTPVERYASCRSFSDWATRYEGLVGAEADGNDVLAVMAAAGPLLDRARAGDGPGFVECSTYRSFGHSKSDPCVYRDDAEEEAWRERDPLENLRRCSGLSGDDVAEVRRAVEEEIETAIAFALDSPPGGRELALADLDLPVPPTSAAEPASCEIAAGTETTITEAIRETLRGELERDGDVLLIGEDIGLYGGAFGVTRGLLDRFGPERIRETPISENGFVGLSVGAAVGGLRPVVELMFGDFITCCTDALVNHAAKLRYMYAGAVSVPFTLRMPIGRRNGYGATHSQSLEALFAHVPGLSVVCPATLPDAVGLLRTAVRTDAPVIFLEPKLLYPARGEMPPADHVVPLGEARAARGHSAEIVDLRSLSPLDLETCAASLQRTGRGICVQEACETGGIADTVIADLLPMVFGYLHAPLEKVAAADCPVPSSPQLEDEIMPSARSIVRKALPLLSEY